MSTSADRKPQRRLWLSSRKQSTARHKWRVGPLRIVPGCNNQNSRRRNQSEPQLNRLQRLTSFQTSLVIGSAAKWPHRVIDNYSLGDNTSPSLPPAPSLSLSLPPSHHPLPTPTHLMSDTALPEGTALPTPSLRDPDAPPSSAGRSSLGASGPDQPPQETTAIPDEIKARLDTVVHSEVSNCPRLHSMCAAMPGIATDRTCVSCRSASSPSSLD